jgi:hypothetical protein
MSHWENPLLLREESFDEAWSRSEEGSILLVAGSGFDPRATVVPERLLNATNRRIDGLIIDLPEDATDLAVRPLALANRARIGELVAASGGELRTQALPPFHDSRSLGRLISRHFLNSGILSAYGEVMLEISAMPRSVFFPLVRGVLQLAHLSEGNSQRWEGNFHVAVCENSDVDRSILEEGTTPMAPIGGFGGAHGDDPRTTIWVPVLGEKAASRVERLYEELNPDETCPVLPWPSRDPRRADRLALEHRRLLFEEIRIEPRNVIHAAERNPFDLYRTLGLLHERYEHALSPLGPVAMVLSSHSSKLLSVGVLLTAYAHELQVQHVSPGSYGLHEDADEENLRDGDEIYDLWLTGEPYQ